MKLTSLRAKPTTIRTCNHLFVLMLLFAGLHSCSSPAGEGKGNTHDNEAEETLLVDIQGHRGARGILPENSIPGFLYALKMGVTTLEMDVVISKDGQVVVSHEPWMSAEICHNVTDSTPLIYAMTYAQIKAFDCGGKGNLRFEQQRPVTTYKPLLTEVFTEVEQAIQQNGYAPVMYNIETKSTPAGDDTAHPGPEVFSQTLYNVIKARGMERKVTIQSFDPRTLRAMKQLDAKLPLVLLVANNRGYRTNVDSLGFLPSIYSPEYQLVDSVLVAQVHADGLKLIPWTVNDSTEMLNLLNLGVDGIITDYPKLGVAVAKAYQNQ